jgi:hypothetical protein
VTRRLALAAALAACCAQAAWAGCGPSNPNCIVPTAPVGTNNNQAASTAFVMNQINLAVASVSNVDGSITVAPTTGAVQIGINAAHANTWTGQQTFVAPILGAATATSVNGLAITPTTATLTLANGKTLTVSNSLTFTGTDLSSVAFAAGGTVAYTGGALSQFAATTSAQLAGVISDETGTGSLVFGTSPTLANPTITGSFTATGLVTNADLASASITINSTACTLGGSCAPSSAASLIVGTTTITSGNNGRLEYNASGLLGEETIASILTAGNGIAITGSTNATIALALNNTSLQASPTPPTGTTSTAPKMMGMGSTCKLTPTYSGRIKVEFNGTMTNSGTGDQVTAAAFYGTGTAPTNGAAATGTSVGPNVNAYISLGTAQYPFSNGGIITGLTPGTAYWFDEQVAAVNAGTASLPAVSCNAVEF